MTAILGFALAVISMSWPSFSLPEIHKQMTKQQLRSVFHVDSVSSVPRYEVVQLLHEPLRHLHSDLLRRQKRSTSNIETNNFINIKSNVTSAREAHHVKKDLSKNPYFSKIKQVATNSNINRANSINYSSDKAHTIDVTQIKEHNVSFRAFGEVLNLTLRPITGLFKNGPHSLRMWTVRTEPNATHGLDMQEVFDEDSSDQIGEVFQDERNMASILMRRHLETGDLIMEGNIGHEMVIKPLPQELIPFSNTSHHVIFKRNSSPFDPLTDFAYMEPDDLDVRRSLKSSRKRRKRSTEDPYMIYPEILVIVDYDGYRLHGGDNSQVKRYFISFWNGVDLRYRLLKGPKVRISIAGIIISRGRDATPYLERNRVGRDAIDSAAALTDMGKYLFRERRLPVYDIAVAITKYDMCRRRKGGRCTKGTAGFAYVGGACVVNKRLEKVNSVAIIEDTGGFSGIIVAAHEVGHLLGAVHDGSPPPTYLGGPGAQRCLWEDGYIMSDLRHTEQGFRWSPCTIQSFRHFLNGDTAICLHNAPHENNALGRSLPGTLLSLDAQCHRDRGTNACFKDERVCAQLFCFDSGSGYCVAYRPAAEGSSCGNGMHCLDGRCTSLQSNIIPDYGNHFREVYNKFERRLDNVKDKASKEDDIEDEDAQNLKLSEIDGIDSQSKSDNSPLETSIEAVNNNSEGTNIKTTFASIRQSV